MKRNHKEGQEKRADNPVGIYSYMDIVAREAEEYASDHTTPLSPLLEEVESITLTQTPYPSMLTGRVEGRFLQLIVQLSGGAEDCRNRHLYRLLSTCHGGGPTRGGPNPDH